MEVSLSPYFILALLHLIIIYTSFSSSAQTLCHKDESLALLQFKDNFEIDKSASVDPFAYPKVESWPVQEENNTSDCCSWDGVKCDQETGNVIELDLSSSCLYGSINSNSTLFRLSQLRRLNLAYNHFNYSQIPSEIGNLSRLVYLNLSYSFFYGQIPIQISHLSKLSSLDLSHNIDFVGSYSSQLDLLLELRTPNLSIFLQNMTNLNQLYLSYVDISSVVPDFLANFSSLTAVSLTGCGMYGEFPKAIFQLPNLQVLSLRDNQDLTGYFPEFHSGCPLKQILLLGTSFSGHIPSSIERLSSLNMLDLGGCNFSGLVPSSMGKLTRLTYLDLSENNFIGQILSFLQNLTQLTVLSLEQNYFHGVIPSSFSRLVNLEVLSLHDNKLSGAVDFDIFLNMKYLTSLQLNANNFSVSITETNSTNATVPQFEVLGLGNCNLRKFPGFLRYQDNLYMLELIGNQIHGQIPNWLWNISLETMVILDLGLNFLTGFGIEPGPVVLPWRRLKILYLFNNMLKGPLPIPPPSIITYVVAKNELTGEIPPLFCNLSSLQYLDLESNKLSGMLPQCLENLSYSLSVLSLRNNSFHGTIPQICKNGSQLRMIDLSHNEFQGLVPPSLESCLMLQFLNLGNNQFRDSFPSWLEKLPDLRVLVLQANQLHGVFGKPISNSGFPHLQVIDISYNNFTGTLPSEYFQKWKSMKSVLVATNSPYMDTNSSSDSGTQSYGYSFTLSIKGTKIFYGRIQDVLAAIDLSNNMFKGEIPESIGSLQGLHVLSLSNNILTGGIPSSLWNLSNLESLDLSLNELSGEIPHQLMQLTFLAFFNVSHNHLAGPIPQGNQFGTFGASSYIGNLGLCGNPLQVECGNSEAPKVPPASFEGEKNSFFGFEFDWITILPGYGSGLVVGLLVGHIVITEKQYWFTKILHLIMEQKKRRTRTRRGSRI